MTVSHPPAIAVSGSGPDKRESSDIVAPALLPKAWWRADYGISTTGSDVDSWKSLVGGHLLTGAGATRPLHPSAISLNGVNIIERENTEKLEGPAASTFVSSSEYTVIVVARIETDFTGPNSIDSPRLFGFGGAGVQTVNIHYDNNQVFATQRDTAVRTTPTIDVGLNSFFVAYSRFTGTNTDLECGVNDIVTQVTVNTGTTLSALTSAAVWGETSGTKDLVAEILVFDKYLQDTDLERYLISIKGFWDLFVEGPALPIAPISYAQYDLAPWTTKVGGTSAVTTTATTKNLQAIHDTSSGIPIRKAVGSNATFPAFTTPFKVQPAYTEFSELPLASIEDQINAKIETATFPEDKRWRFEDLFPVGTDLRSFSVFLAHDLGKYKANRVLATGPVGNSSFTVVPQSTVGGSIAITGIAVETTDRLRITTITDNTFITGNPPGGSSGKYLEITGSAANDGTFLISSVIDDKNAVIVTKLAAGAAGGNLQIYKGASRFQLNDDNGSAFSSAANNQLVNVVGSEFNDGLYLVTTAGSTTTSLGLKSVTPAGGQPITARGTDEAFGGGVTWEQYKGHTNTPTNNGSRIFGMTTTSGWTLSMRHRNASGALHNEGSVTPNNSEGTVTLVSGSTYKLTHNGKTSSIETTNFIVQRTSTLFDASLVGSLLYIEDTSAKGMYEITAVNTPTELEFTSPYPVPAPTADVKWFVPSLEMLAADFWFRNEVSTTSPYNNYVSSNIIPGDVHSTEFTGSPVGTASVTVTGVPANQGPEFEDTTQDFSAMNLELGLATLELTSASNTGTFVIRSILATDKIELDPDSVLVDEASYTNTYTVTNQYMTLVSHAWEDVNLEVAVNASSQVYKETALAKFGDAPTAPGGHTGALGLIKETSGSPNLEKMYLAESRAYKGLPNLTDQNMVYARLKEKWNITKAVLHAAPSISPVIPLTANLQLHYDAANWAYDVKGRTETSLQVDEWHDSASFGFASAPNVRFGATVTAKPKPQYLGPVRLSPSAAYTNWPTVDVVEIGSGVLSGVQINGLQFDGAGNLFPTPAGAKYTVAFAIRVDQTAPPVSSITDFTPIISDATYNQIGVGFGRLTGDATDTVRFGMWHYNGTTTDSVSLELTAFQGSWAIVMCRYDGTSLYIEERITDPTAATVAATDVNFGQGTAPVTMFPKNKGGIKIYLADVYWYNTELNPTQRQDLEDHISAKFF